ncbi:MAG: hypothetical protein AAF750_02325 [Planctomycetota bacterium]
MLRPIQFACLVILGTLASPTDADPTEQDLARPPLVVAEPTTYFTAPLRPDGTVDYFAALNAAAREGIAPDQNAAAYILPLLPESDRLDSDLTPIAAALGIDLAAAHAKGPRLTPLPWNPLDDNDPFGRALDQLWTPEDLPQVAAWLDANLAALDAFDRAVRLPHSYWPVVPDTNFPLLLGVDTSGLGTLRATARAFVIRLNLHAGRGDYDRALRDYETLIQLGYHVSHQQPLIGWLVAASIRSLAVSAVTPLLNDPQLPADAARTLLAVIKNQPDLRPVAACITSYERAIALEVFQTAYARPELLAAGLGSMLKFAARSPKFDINLALREVNRVYDLIEQSAQAQTLVESRRIAQQLEDGLEIDHPLIMPGQERPLRERFSLRIARIGLDTLTPAYTTSAQSERLYQSRQELLLAAAAFTVYRIDHGRYPESLGDLVPEYLTELPVDRYDGRPLTYRPGPERQTYLLYSIGQDGDDDQGKFGHTDGDLSIGNPLPDGW